MKKISEIRTVTGMMLVVYYDGKREVNRFAIYAEWMATTEYGLRKRRRLLERYADFDSCLCYIWEKRNERPGLFKYEDIA